ncbi:MAG: tRNA1(Val) (adenine(37)-N6)-methyltransferase [Eubacterium sp.]|nr:tRNA1(Val) (adenine(37)-N6)-methyltransferase [Eubacterium sp.]
MKNTVRLDDLEIKGYKLYQDPESFCFGIDAVLLSGFARIGKGEKAVDLCSGNGAVALLCAAKYEAARIDCLEINPGSVELCEASIAHNHLEERVFAHTGDVKEATAILGKSVYDAVTVNPPYMKAGAGAVNPHESKAIARHEVLCSLEDVIREGTRLLRPGGRFYMVHRPFRLTEAVRLMHEYGLEAKRLRLVQPARDKEPTMMLIEGMRGAKEEIRVEAPLIIYDDEGRYTRDVLEIYGKVPAE